MNTSVNMEKKSKLKNKPKNRSGWILLAITTILYAVIALSDPTIAQAALDKSLQSLQAIAPVLLLVFFLLAIMNSFIKPKKIAKYLGEKSGFKGEVVALVGGILSHGPAYVWYPILSELRSHGARDGLIVAFFYARAIKLPWLPVMISYFGITFTLVLSTYILLGALLQAVIVDKLAKNK